MWIDFWGRAAREPALADLHRRYYREIGAALVARMAELPSGAADAERVADAVIAAVDGVGTRATLEPELWPAERQRALLKTLLGPLLAPPPEEGTTWSS